MKLNLGAGNDIRLHGYINVDITPRPELPQTIFRQGDAFNLDWLCPEQSVDEILALNLLSMATARQVPQILSHWASRLKLGGTLKLAGVDCCAAGRIIDQRAVGWEEANRLFFGEQTDEFNCCRSLFDFEFIRVQLESLGLKRTTMRREGLGVYVEFIKEQINA